MQQCGPGAGLCFVTAPVVVGVFSLIFLNLSESNVGNHFNLWGTDTGVEKSAQIWICSSCRVRASIRNAVSGKKLSYASVVKTVSMFPNPSKLSRSLPRSAQVWHIVMLIGHL